MFMRSSRVRLGWVNQLMSTASRHSARAWANAYELTALARIPSQLMSRGSSNGSSKAFPPRVVVKRSHRSGVSKGGGAVRSGLTPSSQERAR